ncbi:hypothetical protein PHYPSEUDO_009305 [Phytophthora pseudosyringae]|uniref:Uncharacterized protein n=1 Tax=Phytophthora pseudosyringae TaxID=221518 RepID=A0A8T1VFI8_9STRA|nr:hypothetical protein PHYPSEUDO_009305 [Phytophthora pseudosyringae]
MFEEEPAALQIQTRARGCPLPSLAVRQRVCPTVHGGAVILTSRNQYDNSGSSLFPDEEHAYEPRRHVRFASLSRNALPYSEPVAPQRRRPRNSPPKGKTIPPPSIQRPSSNWTPTSPAVQALRKKNKRNTSPKKLDKATFTEQQHPARSSRVVYEDDRELWGFSVRYSPKQQLETQWLTTQEQRRCDLKVKQQETCQQTTAVRFQKETQTSAADYAQYVYLASLYGPLDAFLYCCCRPGSHGRVYKLLVERSARRLQRWAPKRISVLRRYWVGRLAQELSENSLMEGLNSVVNSFQQQRQATALHQRLKLLQAARALRSWNAHTARMFQIREKMRFALARDLESRFFLWRENVEARKNFRRQFKQITKRKAMQSAFEQWKEWRVKHGKMRCHLMQRWLKLQQDCWKCWCGFVQCNRAADILQRSWRLFAWRKQRKCSSQLIGRVYRGWKTRQRVSELRQNMKIHSVLQRVTNAAAWSVQCEMLSEHRRRLFESQLFRAREEAACVDRAQKQVTVMVEVELTKVLRNEMHRKLEEQLSRLKLDDATACLQSVESSSNLRKLATERLIADQCVIGRREAIAALRATHTAEDRLQTNPCFFCQAFIECSTEESSNNFDFSHEHRCLRGFSPLDGNGDARSEVKNWESIARGELSKIQEREQEHMQKLLTMEPTVLQFGNP